HCHKEEKEFFVCLKGNLTATIDKGEGMEELLMREGTAFYIGNYVWHGFRAMSPDTIMLALSSTNYNPDRSDYIEDYEKYKEIIA
ncbi:MAG: sugar 3,4-ketoisomerase, partial [Patescibacteria group bacterium]